MEEDGQLHAPVASDVLCMLRTGRQRNRGLIAGRIFSRANRPVTFGPSS